MDTKHTIINPEAIRTNGANTGTYGGDSGMPSMGGASSMGGMAGSSGSSGAPNPYGANRVIDPDNPPDFPAPMYSFKVQMAWQEKPLTERLEAKKKAEEAAKPAEEAAAESGENVAAEASTTVTR